jgi:hypothetical protein
MGYLDKLTGAIAAETLKREREICSPYITEK